MSDTKNDNVLSVRPTLQLTKTVEGGKVKQSFQHGRSKTVTVEVRKTRTFARGEGNTLVEVAKAAGTSPRPFFADTDEHGRHLTEEERQARLRVLKQAEEQNRLEAEESAIRAEERARREAAEAERRAAEAAEAALLAPAEVSLPGKASVEVRRSRTDEDEESHARSAGKTLTAVGLSDAAKKNLKTNYADMKAKLSRGESRRGSGKLTVTQAYALESAEERSRSLASVRRAREKARKAQHGGGSTDKIYREVTIPETITVQELAQRMTERAVDVIKVLMKLGVMATLNQTIDADTAELVVSEFGHASKRVLESDVENVLKQEESEAPELLRPRAPVVTVMGHVDHGKTSLLDALRKTDVAAREAGGITQHIGAYQVSLDGSGQRITFLDTPGHEAFTAMRARGAQVTDIVVLVVAADDGIMEQTKEAIAHAKAAGVPILVAINKIDKPGADPDRVKHELTNHDLVPEEFGGEVMVVPVSAKQGTGLDQLKEAILLQAEVLELKANPDRPASGAVVESKIDRGRGVVATLLVQKGTLKVGDIVVAGSVYGRVRALIDDKGKSLDAAGPAVPVEILGLNDAPQAGDEFDVVESERIARDITEYRSNRQRAGIASAAVPVTAENFFGGGVERAKELALIIKGDVNGSVEAIAGSLAKISTDEALARVLLSGVGGITESDVSLAMATGAKILAFNVRANPQAKEQAAREKVDIRYYSVIYDIIDDIKALLGGLLSPVRKENFLGYAEIRQVFNVSKAGKIAGCIVTSGLIKRGAKVRLLRDNVVIHEGALKTLKRFKDDVKEVKEGFECGVAFENYEDIREGDQVEAFEVEEIARTL